MSTIWRLGAEDQWETVSPERISESQKSLAVIRCGQAMGILVRPDAEVRVNGHVVAGGFQLLKHRDEILIGRSPHYYSAHSRPQVERFKQVTSQPPTCPICRGRLRGDVLAVRCPGCQRWYHEIQALDGQRGLRCWTYLESCRFCDHPTDLDGQRLWRPGRETSHA